MNKKIEKNYVSEIDQFIKNYDREHPEKSASQKKEIAKFERIYQLRDTPNSEEKTDNLWDGF